jgi:hypothetical protein
VGPAEVEGADERYVLGRGQPQRPDEIILDYPNGYHYPSLKTRLIRRWALATATTIFEKSMMTAI